MNWMFCNAVSFLYLVLLNLSAASTTWIQSQFLIYWSNLINGIFPKLCVKLTSKDFLSPISSPDLVCHLFTSFKCGKSVQPTVKKILHFLFFDVCRCVHFSGGASLCKTRVSPAAIWLFLKCLCFFFHTIGWSVFSCPEQPNRWPCPLVGPLVWHH